MIKILVIAPEWPPAHCGVADFSKHLFNSLKNKAISKRFILKNKSDLPALFLLIEKFKPNIVHAVIHAEHIIDNSYLNCYRYINSTIEQTRTLIISSYINAGPSEPERINKILAFSSGVIVHGPIYAKLKCPILSSPCGATINRGITISNNTDRNYTVLYFGFINKNKGIELIIDSIKLIPRSLPIKFHFLASFHQNKGSKANPTITLSKDLQNKVRGINDPRVTVDVGYHHLNKLKSQLARCDSCILPFLDGASNKRSSFFNALLFGLPVISTGGTTTPKSFKQIPGLSLCKPDARSIANAVIKTFNDRPKHSMIAKYFDQHFSWKILTDNYLGFYKKIQRSK